MVYIGIDPGYANTGVAWFRDNKLGAVATLINKDGAWITQYNNILTFLFDHIPNSEYVVGIEDSAFFGAKKGIIGLHKLVGALWGGLGWRYGTVYLIQPRDKVPTPERYVKYCASEHEKDAISLALVAKNLYRQEFRNECRRGISKTKEGTGSPSTYTKKAT